MHNAYFLEIPSVRFYAICHPQLVSITNWKSTIINNMVPHTPYFTEMHDVTICSLAVVRIFVNCGARGAVLLIVVLFQLVMFTIWGLRMEIYWWQFQEINDMIILSRITYWKVCHLLLEGGLYCFCNILVLKSPDIIKLVALWKLCKKW